MPQRAKFISMEGVDGSGKTSHIQVLKQHLESRGYRVATTREPGGTDLAEKLRDILLNSRYVDGVTEMLLMAAARRHHVETYIKPLIYQGVVVISDRFVDSSYAYQGFGRGLYDEVDEVHKSVLEGFHPDHTLFFDVPLEESLRRLEERSAAKGEFNRLDKEVFEFRQKVYEGYQHQYRKHPERMVRIDALPPMEDVTEQVIRWANSVFENKE